MIIHKFISIAAVLFAMASANLRAQDDISSWKSFTDTAQGVTFQYPESLGTKYIHTQVWPPEVQVRNETYTCVDTNAEAIGMRKIEERNINGNTYCVTEMSEGAAGTIYVEYTYSFQKSAKVLDLHFVLAFVQCGNYDEPEKSECKKERSEFDIDGLIDRIVQSLTLNR